MMQQQLPPDTEKEFVTIADELRAEGREEAEKEFVTIADELRAEGREEGREEGLQEGLQEGRQEAIQAIVEHLLQEGIDSSVITRLSELSLKEKETEPSEEG